MHACYVTLRLRVTVFEQVGLPYDVCNACTFIYMHCLCCFLFLFLFFFRLALYSYSLDALSYFRIPFRLS